VGSLFSGIGGFDLGLERAGMEVAWQCEIDPAARRVLARHWPDVPCYEDVKELRGDRLPAVDVLCGGFPCQDLSVAGRRAGLAGERSGLFHEFMRLAGELAPRWVLVENVPGLLSSEDGRDMGVVLGTLADLGYGWCYRVLDAQFFGVAQRRRRVFIVGCVGDPGRAARVLLEPESCDGNPPPSREAGARVTQALTGSPSSSSCGNPDDNRAQGGFLVPALTTRCGNTLDDQQTGQLISFHQTQDPIHGDDWSPALGATSIGMGVAYNPYRTLEKDGTITSGFAARPVVDALHGPTGNKEPLIADTLAVRRLTPVECERLQGFPDDWTEPEPDSARYRMLGNAVCVPVAEWIGRRIVASHFGADRYAACSSHFDGPDA
jgi:DNA (cytosine-5)-methyltransferase 1